MRKAITTLGIFLIIAITVNAFYVFYVDPHIIILLEAVSVSGGTLPRNFFVIIKDVEQQVCIMLLFFGLVLCFLRLYQINQHRYLFDIDLLPKLTDLDQLDSSLKELSELPQDLLETPIVQILAGSLRRFQVTKNIESAASSIEPAMQTMLVRYENDMSVIRYIVWAVPSIGFLGTVRGIGQAMAEAETAVAGNIGPMTASLGTAFNSTFVALIISLILMFMVSAIQSSQEKELISVQEYVERYLISRITKLV